MNAALFLNPLIVLAALIALLPLLAAGFWPASLQLPQRLPLVLRMLAPALLAVPYALVALSTGVFRWNWFALYTLVPVAVSLLLYRSSLADSPQRGNWRDYLVLILLGLAVDLRWFEPAWRPHLSIFSKVLLLDAGIYGFLAIRQLTGVGFDLRLRLRDLSIGLLAFAAYAPLAIVLGLGMGFSIFIR